MSIDTKPVHLCSSISYRERFEEHLCLEGGAYFEALLSDIALARVRIELETYIFQDDSLGWRVAHALINAAHRGVRVRVLVDGFGSSGWGGGLTKSLEAAGVETRVYHPFPWRLWQWRRAVVRLPIAQKLIYLISKVNKRNHRKICVIDSCIVYIGSANISHCHLSIAHGGKNWRDTMLRLVGAPLSEVEEAFEAAWNHTHLHERIQHLFESVNTEAIIRLNHTWYRRRVLYKNLLRRLARCRQRVWITNAYFAPNSFMLRKLEELSRKGLDVRILLPQKSDVFLMSWASAAFYEKLLEAGARIFEYLPSMLHAKSLILDDWFLVGSSNLNHRSLLHDLEVDVQVSSQVAKRLLEEQFLEDLKQSKEIDFSVGGRRAWHQRWIGRLILYLRYWI